MSSHRTAAATAEEFELRFCFLCDHEGPHYSTELEGDYVFQCTACFASHIEPLPESLSSARAGRHRAS
ncbi:MAG: hypothetical protein HY996_06730 [Micrococcales bacterium]|nr:hypothetical protein [Micrococcales bacterium]